MPSALGLWGDSLDHLVHLVVAFVLALPIGWHRAREEQSAGLHTFPLVAIAPASIWTVGIMGAAVGYGYYDIGIILTVANLAVLMLRMRSQL
jgi:putative Mg2+ transporter-C (MgtC) family protein